ncbi:MAG TPA: DUF4295 domain-containing protein [Bacteroidales bacterium]|nr:DUF4295 domain-containing protein [Bacteroidales bacterium]
MAKKVVATLQKGQSKSYAKVIKMVKSPKNGSYIFKESVMLAEKATEFLKKEE